MKHFVVIANSEKDLNFEIANTIRDYIEKCGGKCKILSNLHSTEHSSAEHGSAEHGSAEHDSAEHDSAEHSSTEHSSTKLCSVEHGSAEHGSAEHSSTEHSSTKLCSVEHGSVEHGSTKLCSVKHGSASYTNISEIAENTECAIVLGGDGTIIQAASDLAYKNIPILGVNLGTLGFLAEIEKTNLTDALNQLLEDRYEIEKRMMMKGWLKKEKIIPFHSHVLNDIVISRSGFSRIIATKIFINDILMDTYMGDGVIISTPTGSTAYNLSAGGPIISPRANVIVVTPICPHSLTARSVVVAAEDRIQVEIGVSKKSQIAEAIATFDGRDARELTTGDRIEIVKAEETTEIIKLNKAGFFELLRNKLGVVVEQTEGD